MLGHRQKNKLVAILGGSFDPVHLGHIAVADLVYSQLNAPELRFMPCKIAPHKSGYFSDEKHRLAMLRLAIGAKPYIVDEFELSRETTSYTVQSMRMLRAQNDGNMSIAFVIGYDSLQTLHTWWNWEQLFDEVNLVVVGRPGCMGRYKDGYTKRDAGNDDHKENIDECVAREIKHRQCKAEQLYENQCGKVVFLPSSEKNISSSDVRKEIASCNGEFSDSLVYKLGEPVAAYIKTHHLYRK